MNNIKIYRDDSGALKVCMTSESQDISVKLLRYFPLTAPTQHLGLFKLEPNGVVKEEITAVSDYEQLDEESKRLIIEELNKSVGHFQITKIYSIKQVGGGLLWHVNTAKGKLIFEVKDNKDIYLLKPNLAIIKDISGNKYLLIPEQLDSKSKAFFEVYI